MSTSVLFHPITSLHNAMTAKHSFMSMQTLYDLHDLSKQSPWPLTHSVYPIVISIIYYASVHIFQPSVAQAKMYKQQAIQQKQQLKAEGRSKTWGVVDWLVLLHNIILCLFSAIIFYYSFGEMFRHYQSHGFTYAICHGWTGQVLKNCHYAFYLSKYYEYFDTVILLLKHQRPILLSKYHHFGAALIMWVLVLTEAPAGWIFTVFNSFIHTFMYAYYIGTLLGYRPAFKNLITIGQLTQFVTGVAMAVHITIQCQQTNTQKLGTLATIGYTVSLIFLFADFYYKTYLTKPVKAGSKKVQ